MAFREYHAANDLLGWNVFSKFDSALDVATTLFWAYHGVELRSNPLSTVQRLSRLRAILNPTWKASLENGVIGTCLRRPFVWGTY
jgi:hypothetical protein